MIRVLVNGAKGKMGAVAVDTVKADPAFVLVGQTGKTDDLYGCIQSRGAEVVVDFTNASVGFQNFLTIIEAGAHPIIGTSGFTQGHIDQLSVICAEKKIGGIIVPNFSIGAILMMKFAREAAEFMTGAEIVEAHHPQKLDAPSGTAIRTAELIREGLISSQLTTNNEEIVTEVQGNNVQGVPIHSIRLPGILAQQRVIFGAPGETLTIEHNSTDRVSFMAGISLAIKKIVGTNSLYYGLEKIAFQQDPLKESTATVLRSSPDIAALEKLTLS